MMTAPWRTRAYAPVELYAILYASPDIVRLRFIERCPFSYDSDRTKEFVTFDGWPRELKPKSELHKFLRKQKRAGRIIFVEPDLHAFSFSDDKLLPFFVEGE
jgi:hypothetical protein